MRPSDARRLIVRMEIGSAAIGLALGVLVFVAADTVGALLADGADTSGASDIIRLIAVTLPFAGLYEVAMGALRSCDEVLTSTILDRTARPIVQVLSMGFAAMAGWDSTGMVLAWVIPNIATVLLAVLLMARVRLRTLSETHAEVPPSVFWRFTGPRSVARVAQVLTQRLDVLILAAAFSIEEAAVYGAVSRCMIAGVFLATALRQTIQPRLRREIAFGDRRAVKNMYGASTTWLVVATWPIYLAMMTHAPLVMSVFGAKYMSGSAALVLLSSAMLVATACGLVDVVLLMLGHSWLSTINVLIALVLNAVLNLALAPTYGMIGSAIAWVVSILATNLIPLAQTTRAGLHPGGIPLWSGCAVAVVAFGLPMAIERLAFGDAFGPFVIALITASALYGTALYLFRKPLLLDRLVSDIGRPTSTLAHG
jgi:O-antigen/teichoic acid export membrane protein